VVVVVVLLFLLMYVCMYVFSWFLRIVMLEKGGRTKKYTANYYYEVKDWGTRKVLQKWLAEQQQHSKQQQAQANDEILISAIVQAVNAHVPQSIVSATSVDNLADEADEEDSESEESEESEEVGIGDGPSLSIYIT
jgi:hypothetical protein